MKRLFFCEPYSDHPTKNGQKLPAPLQSHHQRFHDAHIMHKPTYLLIITTLLSSLSATSIFSQDPDNLSGTELKDKWGQLIYCQSIYKLAEVKPRLYDFDIEQCDSANQLVADLISAYSPDDQKTLKLHAERHASALSMNTSEPYQAVPACRQYCKRLIEIHEQRKEAHSK